MPSEQSDGQQTPQPRPFSFAGSDDRMATGHGQHQDLGTDS